ncbi:MAG TPA: SDR family NAD(P)-dependent oxidoreductase [Candidatus Sulfotelmatobacter sp.]|nr:SDR family NAD(P)-dependent oxidoreductase [Candidatus Sulfotelmatobacter sp.]
MEFSGSVVLVAGGTGGLGRAVSLAFLAADAKVTVTHRNQEEFVALRKEASAGAAQDGLLEGLPADVTNEGAVREAVDGIIAKHGRVDALVNCVGGYAGGKAVWEIDPQEFERMLSLNLRSGYLLSRAVVPKMLERGSGVIVNIASRAAVDHAAGAASYTASKAAAVAMIDSLAADLRETGVRANSILPSIIDTEANRKAMPKADFSKWPKPEDIAKVILFLCSDEARLIHGAAIPV